MRLSRLGILVLISFTLLWGSSCGPYNKVMARKDLVDGSKAYKDRKFQEAEELFKSAASRDPDGNTLEGRTAQLSLARTLHSIDIGDRGQKHWAEEALVEYKKSLPQSLKNLSTTKAAYDKNPTGATEQKNYLADLSAVDSTASSIASLYDNIEQPDKAEEWQTQVANDANYPETARAHALSFLASKYSACANNITDTDKTKKTVKGKDGKDVFQFVKPESSEDFAKLKECVEQGTKFADQAVALEPDLAKNAKSIDIKGASDTQLAIDTEILSVFDSARAYKASLLYQAMRLAEMDGRTADRDKLKQEAEAANAARLELTEVIKNIKAEADDRAAKKEEAEKGANANAANKK
jgi:hypothetical protein